MSMYTILDRPWVYTLSQFLLAPGAKYFLTRHIRDIAHAFPEDGQVLDVGCGPASWLWKCGLRPVGVDISEPYVEAFSRMGSPGYVASATSLPFPDQSFDAVWSFGMLHHLGDEDAKTSIDEMQRVCRRNGQVAIMDAILPRSVITRPIAYGLRKLDRGAWVRTMESHQLLFRSPFWSFSRFTYSLTGLEACLAIWETGEETAPGGPPGG